VLLLKLRGLFLILQQHDLASLLNYTGKKHPDFDKTIYLKALLSFDDVDIVPLQFLPVRSCKRKSIFNY